MALSGGDIAIIVVAVIGLVLAGLYFLNKWASRKMTDQQSMIDRTKQSMMIYVIDKKKEKVENSNLPKAVLEKIPRMYKFMKMPLVKAKIGPQIMTLMCEKKIFEALPVKKNVKVELAGIYIIGMAGYKTPKQMKALAEQKKRSQDAAAGIEQKWYDKILGVFKKKA